MGCRPKCGIAIDYEYDHFTPPLPRTVLTVSKRDVLTFEARSCRLSVGVASSVSLHGASPCIIETQKFYSDQGRPFLGLVGDGVGVGLGAGVGVGVGLGAQ
jgi:hypothetical protein